MPSAVVSVSLAQRRCSICHYFFFIEIHKDITNLLGCEFDILSCLYPYDTELILSLYRVMFIMLDDFVWYKV